MNCTQQNKKVILNAAISLNLKIITEKCKKTLFKLQSKKYLYDLNNQPLNHL